MAALTQDIIHPGALECLPAPKASPRPELPPKRHKTHGFASSTSPHRGISRSSTCLLRLHHLETLSCVVFPPGPHLGPSTSQHPPFPWLGSQCWGQDPPDPAGQDTVCKRHIHIANHIGVRLLVKGFVSDPSPRGTDRERAQSGQAGRGLEREKQRGG